MTTSIERLDGECGEALRRIGLSLKDTSARGPRPWPITWRRPLWAGYTREQRCSIQAQIGHKVAWDVIRIYIRDPQIHYTFAFIGIWRAMTFDEGKWEDVFMSANGDSNPLDDPELRRVFAERESSAGILSIGVIPDGHEGPYKPTENELREGARFVAEARARTAQTQVQLTIEALDNFLKIRQELIESYKER
jgi:hypothetical protein